MTATTGQLKQQPAAGVMSSGDVPLQNCGLNLVAAVYTPPKKSP